MHYKKNFLRQVVLRLDHSQNSTLKSEQKTAFTDRVQADFPIAVSKPSASVVISMSPNKAGIQQEFMGRQWEHRKVERGTKVLTLAPEFLSLQYGRDDYDHFPPFRSEFRTAFDAALELFPGIQLTRLGLRYVNIITFAEGNPLDWSELINEGLVASVKAGLPDTAGPALARSMHQLQFKMGSAGMTVNYGIANPEHPAPVSRREFVLDIDAGVTPFLKEDVMSLVGEMNENCEQLFEKYILNGLRDKMERIDD